MRGGGGFLFRCRLEQLLEIGHSREAVQLVLRRATQAGEIYPDCCQIGLFESAVKLAITIPATIVLFVHMRPIGPVTHIAAARALSSADLDLQIQMVAAAGAAVAVLLVARTVSVYKPQIMTQYGWRKQQRRVLSQP